MAARTDSLSTNLLRWFMAPAALGSMLAARCAAITSRARRPSLPRMSDEWLREHGISSHDDWW
jgi:hypothetical protein